MSKVTQAGTISVLIASMGRPSLRQTLESIAEMEKPSGYGIEIIVADDSLDDAALRVVANWPTDLQVTLVPVGARNASLARNACLDHANGEWLAFVDDDETVDPQWLAGLLDAAIDHDADAVFGPVRHLYPKETPSWFVKADPMFFDLRWHQSGRQTASGHTANALVRHATLLRLGMRFDVGFGKSGGEDDDLFRRMTQAGAKLVVTDRAVVFEQVPAARANPAYIMTRATRGGQTYGKITLRSASVLRKAWFAADAVVKLVAGAMGAAALRPFDRARSFKFSTKVAVNRGKLLSLTDAALKSSWT